MSDIFLHYYGNNPMKPNPSCNNSVIKELSLTVSMTRIFLKRLTESRFIRAPDMSVFLKLLSYLVIKAIVFGTHKNCHAL